MNIYVKRLTEQQPLSLTVQASDTIAEVKTLIQESLGILPSVQKLVLRKKELNNEEASVMECGVAEGSILLLLVIVPKPAKEITIEIDLIEEIEEQLEEALQTHKLSKEDIDDDPVDFMIILATGQVLDMSASKALFDEGGQLPSGARLKATFRLVDAAAQQEKKAKQVNTVTATAVERSDCLLKLMLVGDSGVGKSNFMSCFADNTFTDSHIATIGMDFKHKTIQALSKSVRLQIWDTAGHERFRTITQSYFRGTDAVMIMYDVCDRDSFSNVGRWVDEANRSGNKSKRLILVGNKCDMESDRKVTSDEGQQLAAKLGIAFIEASAKDATNVEKSFSSIVYELL